VLAEYPQNARVWMSYGHALKTTNRQGECVADVSQEHRAGARISARRIGVSRTEDVQVHAGRHPNDAGAIGQAKLTTTIGSQFHFALGKAFEDAGQFAESFQHYAKAIASARRRRLRADWNSEQVRRRKHCSLGILRGAGRAGAQAPDPIFVVGLPRRARRCSNRSCRATAGGRDDGAGGHRQHGARARRSALAQGQHLSATDCSVDAAALRALGERYLEQTRIYRRTDAPFFIDKLPNNFAHTV
jgi:hypothetical protein